MSDQDGNKEIQSVDCLFGLTEVRTVIKGIPNRQNILPAMVNVLCSQKRIAQIK